MKTTKHLIRLSFRQQWQCQELAAEHNPRRSNWRDAKASESGRTGKVTTHNLGQYSRKCKYTHYEYTATMRSFGVVFDDGKRVKGLIGKHKFALTAPHGYHFGGDTNGLKLVSNARPTDDYHPNTDEIETGVQAMLRKLRENAKVRHEQEKKMRFEAAKTNRLITGAMQTGCRVCFDDSLAAGNCETGTRNFCSNHGLDPMKSYSPRQLLAMANGNLQQVRLSVMCAMERHTRMASISGVTVFYP